MRANLSPPKQPSLPATRQATKYYTLDSGIALLLAFLINLAVVCTFAKQFYAGECATASVPSACFIGDSIDRSQPNYGTCDEDGTGLCQEIGLSAAASALKGTLGSSAKYIWAVGLLVRTLLARCVVVCLCPRCWRSVVGGCCGGGGCADGCCCCVLGLAISAPAACVHQVQWLNALYCLLLRLFFPLSHRLPCAAWFVSRGGANSV